MFERCAPRAVVDGGLWAALGSKSRRGRWHLFQTRADEGVGTTNLITVYLPRFVELLTLKKHPHLIDRPDADESADWNGRLS